MKFMKLFELQTKLTSFAYPVVKIIICLSLIVLSFLRNKIFQFSNVLANAMVALLCFVITIFSILCLYISVGEVFHTIENRKSTNCQSAKIKQMTVEEITKIVSENDIVEIEVCKNGKIVKVGASADCEYSSFDFKDKSFYVSDSEYVAIELFTEALVKLFPEGSVSVIKIDGVPVA